MADVVRDYSKTVMLSPLEASLDREFRNLEKRGSAEMKAEGLREVAMRSIDIRYAGQGHEINLDWTVDFVRRFHYAHRQRYGYADSRRPVEVVNVRVRMIAPSKTIPFPRQRPRPGSGRQAALGKRPVFCGGRFLASVVYDRALLQAGDTFAGPALVVEYTATTFVPPQCKVTVDAWDNLVIEVGGS